MYKNFNDYFLALKQRRDEDEYIYTDEDLDKYIDWIKTCFDNNMSCYLCLEMIWFETEEAKEKYKEIFDYE